MTLLASSPSYFRGFTLISVKEGKEGITDDDYAGQFQVGNNNTVVVVTNMVTL